MHLGSSHLTCEANHITLLISDQHTNSTERERGKTKKGIEKEINGGAQQEREHAMLKSHTKKIWPALEHMPRIASTRTTGVEQYMGEGGSGIELCDVSPCHYGGNATSSPSACLSAHPMTNPTVAAKLPFAAITNPDRIHELP